MTSRSWIPYAALLVVFWGVWGAFSTGTRSVARSMPKNRPPSHRKLKALPPEGANKPTV